HAFCWESLAPRLLTTCRRGIRPAGSCYTETSSISACNSQSERCENPHILRVVFRLMPRYCEESYRTQGGSADDANKDRARRRLGDKPEWHDFVTASRPAARPAERMEQRFRTLKTGGPHATLSVCSLETDHRSFRIIHGRPIQDRPS